jgi:Tol biopolymer transport system component
VFYSLALPEGDLYISRVDGTGLRQVTGDAAIDRVPRWSPDGRWIAFFSTRSGSLEVWKIRPDGSDLQQVTQLRRATYAAWSNDGRIATTALARAADEKTDVAVFDAVRPWREQTPDVLPRMPGELDFFVTAFTSDNRRLVGQVGPGPSGVVVYSFASRSYDRLTTFGEWPDVFPDGRHILFVSGGRDFFVVDAATHQVAKAFSVARDVIGPPRLTRDGRAAFFIRRTTESDIWLVTLDAVR